ncbi:MAG: hypothetical protein B0A82_05625 [Alkalinema sp. CACIAM 70d]|nr:MAG: hypothetical protein B0A82_05625 [Alkalinema sp. CACIAM 70d]
MQRLLELLILHKLRLQHRLHLLQCRRSLALFRRDRRQIFRRLLPSRKSRRDRLPQPFDQLLRRLARRTLRKLLRRQPENNRRRNGFRHRDFSYQRLYQLHYGNITQKPTHSSNPISPEASIAIPLLRHRLILRPEAQLDGLNINAVIQGLLNQVTVPR